MTFEEAVELLGEPIKPSPEEEENGWTEEELTIYVAEREMAARDSILFPKPKRPDRTEHKLKWP